VLNLPLQHPYFRQEILLTTKHNKYAAVAPAFQEHLKMTVVEHTADTDLFGTFSGEIERTLTAGQTAIAKAKMGLAETGKTLGLASEGTIGADSGIGFLNSDVEILALVDLERGIEILERFRSFDITAVKIVARPGENLDAFFEQADFPNHRLIARPNKTLSQLAIKGLATEKKVQEALSVCSNESQDGMVLIESDLRAMYSPSRQKNIAQASALLAARVLAQCPDCLSPGWGKVDVERGLPCSDCQTDSEFALKREIFGCVRCEYREPGELLAKFASPSQCKVCNP
jgi:hypothetical protein